MTKGSFFVINRLAKESDAILGKYFRGLRPLSKREVLGIALTAGSQIFLGYFTLFIQAIYPVWSAPFWPASGAALAALLLGGPRMLLGVYLGLLVLGFKFFWGPYPIWMAMVVPLGNLMETGLAYFLLRYFVPKFDPGFTHIRQLAAFLLLCPWLPALTSAATIQFFLQKMGTIPPDRFLSEVAVYTLGNATGILLVTPLILVWRDLRSFRWRTPQGTRILGLILVILVGLSFYAKLTPTWLTLVAVAMIPFAIWGVWMTGVRGATVACLLVAVSYFAFDVPGAKPLSSLLEEKQRSAELSFVMEKKLQGVHGDQPPPRLAREISDQIGLLALICITLLPLGVAADDLRNKVERDRLAMQALASSFWSWTPMRGYEIENPEVARHFLPWTKLFLPERDRGSLKIRPGDPVTHAYVSHWAVSERDRSGNPLRVSGILQNFSAEEERDTAVAQVRLTELEIQTLRSHLNPHLLFNCLTGLRGLITEDPARARDFSGSLARFLRAVVDSEKQKCIPLSTELAICRDFLELEALRGRPTRLNLHLNPEDGVVPIPPLTLVTLVENAAKHGFRNGAGSLAIEVHADRPEAGWLRLQIRQPGSLQTPGDTQNHAGLDLIRRQLEMVFPGQARLALAESPPGTVVAELQLPA